MLPFRRGQAARDTRCRSRAVFLLAVQLCLSWAVAAQAGPSPGTSVIQRLIADSQLDDLRWPDFSDYRKHLDNFYKPLGYGAVWSRDGAPTPQAKTVIALLKAADDKGVNAFDYDAPRWDGRVNGLRAGGADAQGRFDVQLSVTLMRYISDLHIGRINPRNVAIDLDIEHKKYDLPALLGRLKDDADPAKTLEDVEPHYEGYRLVRAALVRYRKIAADGDQPQLPAVKLLEPGGVYEALPQLAAFLRRIGDLPSSASVELGSNRYEGALVDAVRHFQHRHGLDDDGRIGPATMTQLNVPLSRRVDQIRWTMERWRWMPGEFKVPAIVVNIPEFRLRAYDGAEKPSLTMPVVVGKAFKNETPVFQESMEYLVFQPYWNVPPSIQRNEIAPKLSVAYLQKNNYEVVDSNGNVITSITPAVLAGVRNMRYSVRQKPGPKNSLGRVKFIFPNANNIYLHDTPAQALFERSRRDFSHGCIRVGDPAALAVWLLKNDRAWTREAVDQALSGGPPNRHVRLKEEVPVLILYGTAIADPGGDVHFFDDIYGHDVTLENALAQGYPYPA